MVIFVCRDCKEEFKTYGEFHAHKTKTGHRTVDQKQGSVIEKKDGQDPK